MNITSFISTVYPHGLRIPLPLDHQTHRSFSFHPCGSRRPITAQCRDGSGTKMINSANVTAASPRITVEGIKKSYTCQYERTLSLRYKDQMRPEQIPLPESSWEYPPDTEPDGNGLSARCFDLCCVNTGYMGEEVYQIRER